MLCPNLTLEVEIQDKMKHTNVRAKTRQTYAPSSLSNSKFPS